MGFEIIWTRNAIETFQERIAYLEEHWTEKEIYAFTKRVNEFLQLLETQPSIFRKSTKKKDTHIGLLLKQVSVVYRFKRKGGKIELIAFIDNRNNPQNQSY